MAEIRGKVTTRQAISGNVKSSSAINGEIDKNVKDRLYRDYNLLHNKPSIEGVELIHDKTLEDLGIERFLYGSTEYWNSFPELVAQANTVYVYVDYKEIDGKPVPGFKLGDGTSYLIDMPYTDAEFQDHIKNRVVHITAEERIKWNNKVSVSVNPVDNSTLIFTVG